MKIVLWRIGCDAMRLGMRQAVRKLVLSGKDTEGAVLLEFTLFAPLLIVMAVYLTDYGLFFFEKIEMQNAAQAGAHWALVNGIYNQGDIANAGKNATALSAAQVTIQSRQFCGCSEDSSGNPIVTQASTGACAAGSICASGTKGTYVTVTATPSSAFQFVQYGLFSSPPSVSASATVRIQ